MRTCSMNGCAQKHHCKGFCKQHYDRSPALKAARSQWRKTPIARASSRRRKRLWRETATTEERLRKTLREEYGLSIERWHSMLAAQQHACRICGLADPSQPRLSVDHCHSTGAVRGLLCNRCNRALGIFGDSAVLLARAALYLEGRL